MYLLWSNKHNAWWRPDGRGYTEDLAEAGAYTEAEAVDHVVRSAGCMDRTKATLMVAAPHDWVSPVPPEPEVMLLVAGPGPLVDVLAEAFPRMAAQQPASITCPCCGTTSYHPQDVVGGYCGYCHDWTTPRPPWWVGD